VLEFDHAYLLALLLPSAVLLVAAISGPRLGSRRKGRLSAETGGEVWCNRGLRVGPPNSVRLQ